MTLKMLDCFCGMGGMSEGFAAEGFDVTGIDIVDAPLMGYKFKFIQADMKTLSGKDFQGFDVIHGSPPCRDFSVLTHLGKKYWKDPPNTQRGLALVQAYLHFKEEAQPRIWIMENVPGLTKYLQLPPVFVGQLTGTMKRAFFGNFPPFLLSSANEPNRVKGKNAIDGKWRSWKRAKLPLATSRAFAKACKEVLEVSQIRAC
jgi:site-specific DNA-cytosine methylase